MNQGTPKKHNPNNPLCPLALSFKGGWSSTIPPQCNCSQEQNYLDSRTKEERQNEPEDITITSEPKENWEKEFDEKFTPHNPQIESFGWSKQDMNGAEQIKSFIRSHFISKERIEEEIERYRISSNVEIDEESIKYFVNEALDDLKRNLLK